MAVKTFSWRDENTEELKSVDITEDILLNRKKALQALRTADEAIRCSGEVFEELFDPDEEQTYRTGRVCAIGVIYKALDINNDFMSQVYTQLATNPGKIYGMNDHHNIDGSYVYSWAEIADNLETYWVDN
jgi:hypothetical protein